MKRHKILYTDDVELTQQHFCGDFRSSQNILQPIFQPIYDHSNKTNSSASNFFKAYFHCHRSFLITIKMFTSYQTHRPEDIRYNSHPKKRLQPFITTVKNTSYRQTKTISLLCCLLQIPTSSNCLLLDASDHQLISSNCWFLVTSNP